MNFIGNCTALMRLWWRAEKSFFFSQKVLDKLSDLCYTLITVRDNTGSKRGRKKT